MELGRRNVTGLDFISGAVDFVRVCLSIVCGCLHVVIY
jgi:hypothetical protein